MVQTEGSGYKRWYTEGEWYKLNGLVINGVTYKPKGLVIKGGTQKVSGTN